MHCFNFIYLCVCCNKLIRYLSVQYLTTVLQIPVGKLIINLFISKHQIFMKIQRISCIRTQRKLLLMKNYSCFSQWIYLLEFSSCIFFHNLTHIIWFVRKETGTNSSTHSFSRVRQKSMEKTQINLPVSIYPCFQTCQCFSQMALSTIYLSPIQSEFGHHIDTRAERNATPIHFFNDQLPKFCMNIYAISF